MRILILLIGVCLSLTSSAQDTICVNNTIEHTIQSKHLNENRSYWVSLPLHYADSNAYPVIYVLDAEWRFDVLRHIAFDMGANEKIENAIVIGIPHIDWEYKRGQDLTFSQSRIEYDGEHVDSTWFNESNSGQAMNFYHYLTEELIPDVNKHYATNGHETLIGHSYGGYFGAYVLSLDNPFEVIHTYDPSVWYSDGDVIERVQNATIPKATKFHLTYQPIPKFHKEKIEELIEVLGNKTNIELTTKFYPEDTHNALYLDSFYSGIGVTSQK